MISEEIQYLCFEGGGGMCIAYLGAIKALEEKKFLPIVKNGKTKLPEKDQEIPTNNIRGVSGSSGGALIAFFLSMGLSAVEIESLLNEPFDKKDNQFVKFFDYPIQYLKGVKTSSQFNNQYYRSVDQVKSSSPSSLPYVWVPEEHSIPSLELSSFKKFLLTLSEPLIQSFTEEFQKDAERLFEILFQYFGKEIGSNYSPSVTFVDPTTVKNDLVTKRFLFNLFLGRGVFSGFGVREYLQEKMKKYLLTPQNIARFKELYKFSPKEGEITFEQFYALTGVNLVVTGTNVTRRRPEYFSKDFNSNFPVVEAIGISMAFPILYKPIVVKDINHSVNFYIDGGTLNNLPIHAFDPYFYNDLYNVIDSQNPYLSKPMNPHVVGFRVAEGDGSEQKQPVRDLTKTAKLLKYCQDLIGTLLYPSEEGQLRTPIEREHTIELLSYGLRVADYNPKTEVKKKAIDEAYSSTKKWLDG